MSDATVQLPFRPRLGDHVMVRRHEVNGEIKPHLFDQNTGMVYELTDDEIEQVLCMDGTRDFGGLVLAIVREGRFRRASDVQQLLGQMQQAGLLVDGIAPPAPAPERRPDRPLEPLPGYLFTCDGAGSCCTTFSSVPFSREEAERALSTAADRIHDRHDRAFLPLWGGVDRKMMAVTMRDGQCPFLLESRRCAIHERATAADKPLGCRIFPTTFTDDGEAIRISVKAECPCVLRSAGATDGEPLASPEQHVEADLHDRVAVVRLDDVAITAATKAPATELRAWSRAIAEAEIRDGVAACFHLAAAVERAGLDAEAAVAALAEQAPPSVDDLRAHLSALARVSEMRRESAAGRLPHDRIRLLSTWCHEAASALTADENVLQRLGEIPHPARESFYIRAAVWGHHLASGRIPVSNALRDRGIRLLLARQMAHSITPEARDDAAADHPIAAMEAMMRGRALERYADSVG